MIGATPTLRCNHPVPRPNGTCVTAKRRWRARGREAPDADYSTVRASTHDVSPRTFVPCRSDWSDLRSAHVRSMDHSVQLRNETVAANASKSQFIGERRQVFLENNPTTIMGRIRDTPARHNARLVGLHVCATVVRPSRCLFPAANESTGLRSAGMASAE